MRKIGVVVINFNGVQYIKDALNSLSTQIWTGGLQVVVVDDCSTNEADRTMLPKIVGLFRNKHAMDISLIEHAVNKGPNAARNTGIEALIDCDYVVCLDNDDKLPSNYLSSLQSVLESDPLVDVVYTGVKHFGLSTMTSSAIPFSGLRIRSENFVHSASMFRWTAWRSINGFDESDKMQVLEDWMNQLDIYKEGSKFKPCNDTWLDYRIKEGSRNMGSGVKIHNAIVYLKEKYGSWLLR